MPSVYEIITEKIIKQLESGAVFESLGVVRHRERSFHQRGIGKTWLGPRRRANALATFAQRKDLSSAEGCMGLNAISEFGQRDAGVTRITRNAGRRQRQTLMRVLTRA